MNGDTATAIVLEDDGLNEAVPGYGEERDWQSMTPAEIIAAIKEARAKGSGVIAVNGKMVDRPVVLRAERVVALAIASGILNEEELS